MAFRRVVIPCFICGVERNPQQMPRIFGEENMDKREIAEKRRRARGREDILIEEGTRICHNCNQSIFNELRTMRNDEDPTRLDVLVQTSSSTCFVCNADHGLERLSLECRVQIYIETKVFVPNGTKSCPAHLNEEQLLLAPLLQGIIGVNRPYVFLRGKELMNWMEALRKAAKQSFFKIYEDETNLSEKEFEALTPITKAQFPDLYSHCESVELYGNRREIRKKDLLVYLCKLRQGISDEFLAAMFKFSSRQSVSLAVTKVRMSLMRTFVPRNLGFGAITREEYIREHITEFHNILYNNEPNVPKAITYIDATYEKIQKSRNFQVLRQSFCVHKGHHLLKPGMIVAPNGYILAVHGPYFSDSRNNDAAMLRNELQGDIDGIRTWFQEGDIFIVDRGYRDANQMLQHLGIEVKMPALLAPRQRQHTTADANATRLVTKTRWIVEARNGHIKSMFKFFRDVIPMHHVPNLGDHFRIACAIINKYHVKVTMEGANAELAQRMLAKAIEPNVLQARVEAERLHTRNARWLQMNEEHLPGFPRLDLAYLRDLTFGTYQVRLAPAYIQDKRQREANDVIEFDELFNEPGLLRMRVHSRHINAARYLIWIWYHNYDLLRALGQEVVEEDNPILGYYCTCKSGARTLGTCAHVASVLWFLGYARHQPNVHYPWTDILRTANDSAHRHGIQNPDVNDAELPEIVENEIN